MPATQPSAPAPTPSAPPPVRTEGSAAAPSASTLHGLVRDSAGRPIAHATLTLVDRYGRQRALARTGEDGTYALTAEDSLPCTLVVSAEGYRPRAVQMTSATPSASEVTLPGLGRVGGTVRHGRTGLPVSDARVTVLDSSGKVVASALTVTDGTYALQDLAPGDYTVVTTGYAPVTAQVPLGEGETRQVDLHVGHCSTERPTR
ncbi:carboxypeptidase-like regulatory domain-containing protein [Streptomyces sp. NPDC007206]|uniref:MSCRAMM family protein n=1 Tax=Streptomyces sp. NPDC007206 TaxID=3154317 RepID=UPI0033F654CC